jgi:hypothetical protein
MPRKAVLPAPSAGRVAGKHSCLPAPSEPYGLVSSPTAQAGDNAPSSSHGPRAPTRIGPYPATLPPTGTPCPDTPRLASSAARGGFSPRGPTSPVRRGSLKPPALRMPAGFSEAGPARPCGPPTDLLCSLERLTHGSRRPPPEGSQPGFPGSPPTPIRPITGHSWLIPTKFSHKLLRVRDLTVVARLQTGPALSRPVAGEPGGEKPRKKPASPRFLPRAAPAARGGDGRGVSITGRRSLPPSSSARSLIGLPYGLLSPKGGLRVYHVPRRYPRGLGRVSRPLARQLRQGAVEPLHLATYLLVPACPHLPPPGLAGRTARPLATLHLGEPYHVFLGPDRPVLLAVAVSARAFPTVPEGKRIHGPASFTARRYQRRMLR